jgi:hypothetical protein
MMGFPSMPTTGGAGIDVNWLLSELRRQTPVDDQTKDSRTVWWNSDEAP